ncbi:MAG: hypothetical protein E6713_07380 [Sporomusaceae bacterium]|nr:hypothetical protein [Sporomusaceae bacterium]
MSNLSVSACLAYDSLQADLKTYQGCFMITLHTEQEERLHVTLSYTQTKELADGLSQLLSTMVLQSVGDPDKASLFGDLVIQFLSEKEEELCQPINLSVRMENAS